MTSINSKIWITKIKKQYPGSKNYNYYPCKNLGQFYASPITETYKLFDQKNKQGKLRKCFKILKNIELIKFINILKFNMNK